MEARKFDFPAAICYVSLGPLARGAGRKRPLKGRSVLKTADQNAQRYLRTNERSEQARELRRQCVQKGRPVGSVAVARVAVLIQRAAVRLEAAGVGSGGKVVRPAVVGVVVGTRGEAGALRDGGGRGLLRGL